MSDDIKTVLMNIAVRWLQESDRHDEEGNADCGTGADVPYALAHLCREHAKAIEQVIDLIK